MAVLLNEIQWSAPFIPPIVDKKIEKQFRKMIPPGPYPDVLRFLAHRPWLLNVSMILFARPLIVEMPPELPHIITLIACQENSCRFCYGAQRAGLRLAGYSENDLRKMELDIYEGNEQMKVLADFVRVLSRSNPRPAAKEYSALKKVGFSDQTISEIVFRTTTTCFNNRFATLSAAPPMKMMESLPNSFFGRIMKPIFKSANKPKKIPPATDIDTSGFLEEVIEPIQNHPGAAWLRDTIDLCFESDVIRKETKLLMLGVVARALSCEYCVDKSSESLHKLGHAADEVESTLDNLGSGSADSDREHLLQWVRKTIRYIPLQIQNDTKELMNLIGPEKTVEAIGTSAIINMVVRLAMLRQR